MGWIAGAAHDHEGYVANELADGRRSSSISGGGVIVHDLTAADVAAGYEIRRYPNTDYIDVIVPWDQVVRWRVMCSCGWTGSAKPVFGPENCCPKDVKDDVFLPEWNDHVAPFEALTELGDLAEQLQTLETKLGEHVALARQGGASWSQIGHEVGLSKQGAQQRWG